MGEVVGGPEVEPEEGVEPPPSRQVLVCTVPLINQVVRTPPGRQELIRTVPLINQVVRRLVMLIHINKQKNTYIKNKNI